MAGGLVGVARDGHETGFEPAARLTVPAVLGARALERRVRECRTDGIGTA
eukprot:SAG31_NODE_16509_length_706_cov_1.233937_1_plen_49_part_10